MKIGGEYSSEKVTPKDFERLAEEARLAKTHRQAPRARTSRTRCLPLLAQDNLLHIPSPQQSLSLIRERCENAGIVFRYRPDFVANSFRPERADQVFNGPVAERSSALSPFHAICTPMHTRMKDDSRITTFIADSPNASAMRSAKR